MKFIIILILAILFLIDSVLRMMRSNFNLGALMMYGITTLLWIYVFFGRHIDAFCARGVGWWLRLIFLCGCAALMLLMGFVAVSGYSNPATHDEKAVVVLGAAVYGQRVSGILARRLDATYEYHLKNPEALIVVTGGQGSGEDIPEAVAMKRYLVEKGVPANLILEEGRSTSTEENFRFAREILLEHGLSPDAPIAYATNAFHCYRAGKYALLAGFPKANAVPASIGFSSILPCYMREALAVLYYWVFRA